MHAVKNLELKEYPLVLNRVIDEYKKQLTVLDVPSFVSSNANLSNKLRVGWFSGDLSYHPVGRFFLGFSQKRLHHHHLLFDTCDHGAESRREWFKNTTPLDVFNYSNHSLQQQIQLVREHNLDIAIDLSGWTSGHFMRGFLSRLAPIQISYLGYFASTGLPNMDFWLGDHSLFPSPMMEWSSEKLIRLDRCFIAWDPPAFLPEGSVSVPDAINSPDIRFGCFNHHRKFSDLTLRTWGKILQSIPGSTLVLKRGTKEDGSTQSILASRFRKSGLDPERIFWIDRAQSSEDHLLQYAYIDSALDCFPNGGCTTTCEALWMGTPVITLSGNSYVSRMSTAVLSGAGLSEFCANTVDEYIQLAVFYSQSLSDLRSSREQWRTKIINSELGNSHQLVESFEDNFSQIRSG